MTLTAANYDNQCALPGFAPVVPDGHAVVPKRGHDYDYWLYKFRRAGTGDFRIELDMVFFYLDHGCGHTCDGATFEVLLSGQHLAYVTLNNDAGLCVQELGGNRCGSTVWSQRVHVAMSQASNLSAVHAGSYCNQGVHGDLGDQCVKTVAVVSKTFPGIVGQNNGSPTVKYGTIYLPFDVSKTSQINLPAATIQEEISNAQCVWDDIINVQADCSTKQSIADYIDGVGNVYAGMPVGYVPDAQENGGIIDRIMLFPECDAITVKDFDVFTIRVAAVDLHGNNRAMHSFIHPRISTPNSNDRILWTSYQKDEYTVFHFFVYYLEPSLSNDQGADDYAEARISFYSDNEYYYASSATIRIGLDTSKQALQFPNTVFTGIKYTIKPTTVIDVVEGNIWVVDVPTPEHPPVSQGMLPTVSDIAIVIGGVGNGKILVSDKWSSDHQHDNPKEVMVRTI